MISSLLLLDLPQNILLADFNLGMFVLQLLLFVVSLWLIFLVLIQRGKGGGLTGALGGSGGSSAFGAKAGDAFTKVTVVSASLWIFLCMLTIAFINPPPPPEPTAANNGAVMSGAEDDAEGDSGASTMGGDDSSAGSTDAGSGSNDAAAAGSTGSTADAEASDNDTSNDFVPGDAPSTDGAPSTNDAPSTDGSSAVETTPADDAPATEDE